MGAGAFGVNDTLWDALAVKMRKQIDEMVVLQEERAVLA